MSATRLLDDLARTLAEPMPRRQAVRVLGVTLAAVAIPGLRPAQGQARSAVCDFGCGPNRTRCPTVVLGASGPNVCCPPPLYRYYCGGTPFVPDSVKCVDKCPPPGEPCPSKVLDGSGCPRFNCCQRPDRCIDGECRAACPPERSGCGICCAPGQYCDRSRKMCCGPDPDLVCRGPEKGCKARADAGVEEWQRESCAKSRSKTKTIHQSITGGGSGPDMKAEAYYSLGCFFFTEAVLRRKRYSECRQVADDSLCPSGVSCDEQTGLCKKPLCPRNARMTSQAELPPDPGTARRPSAAIATGPSRVRAELNRHEPALTRSLGRVAKLFDRKPTAARQRALASALDGYRRDFDALIVDVEQIGKADPSASSAAKATLTTLRHASSGLEDFAEALRAAVTSKAISRGTRGKRSFAKAAASSGKARRLLGCGDAC